MKILEIQSPVHDASAKNTTKNDYIDLDRLRSLASETTRKSKVLRLSVRKAQHAASARRVKGCLHSDTLGVNGSQVGVLEERHEVSLSSLLEGHDGR